MINILRRKRDKVILTDYEMQNWLEEKGHILYNPIADNDTDIDKLHELALSYGFKWNQDDYLWTK